MSTASDATSREPARRPGVNRPWRRRPRFIRLAMSSGMIHLVLGDVAAGVLGEAMAGGAPPAAQILRFRDIYCLGPLGELGTAAGAASRAAYWRQILPESPPGVADFEKEEARYAQVRVAAGTSTLLLWVGAHSSSQLWLQRLCSVLPPHPRDAQVVEVADAAANNRGRRALSQVEPHELGRLLGRARRLGSEEIADLARAWQENAAAPSGVRRWSDGRISHHGDDFYDALLLAQCDDEWQPAQQAVGSALWECDEFLGDLFFAWRLRCLAQAGRVEWRGPQERLSDAMVRLRYPEAGG